MGRMDQGSRTQEFIPEVTCFSATQYAPELLFSLWWGSRHKESITPDRLHQVLESRSPRNHELWKNRIYDMILEAYPEYSGYPTCPHEPATVEAVVKAIVKTLIESDLPPLESVAFTFEIDNCTVAFREQLVRGRKSGYWTQTSRTMNLEFMDVNRSRSIELLGGEEARRIYDETAEQIRRAYSMLKDLGVPEEDIRLQPSAQVHRVYWFTNLRVLIQTLKKRSDWIAQGSMWTPIIAQIVSSISCRYAPWFGDLLRTVMCSPKVDIDDVQSMDDESAPCVVNHHYDIENMDRYTGKDPQPVDPLWLAYKNLSMPEHTDIKFYQYLKSMYINLWPDLYLEVLGWNRDDPEEPGYYDIPKKIGG